MSEEHAEPKQKRKASGDNVTTLRTENMTSGEILRAAREKRKLTLEDVSSAIHVRTAQLRAIEEGNIDALPGMTYAVGFVKSYASYLKLNPVDLGNKFKSEHGALKPLMPDLPEIKPVVESRMPDPRIVGVAAFFAVLLLLGWTLFSSDDNNGDAGVPPVVVAEDGAGDVIAEAASENVTDQVVAGDADASGSPEDAAPEQDDKAAKAAQEADKKAEEVKAEETAKAKADAQALAAAEAEEADKKKAAAEAVAAAAQEAQAVEQPEVAVAPVPAATDETINIRKAGRVTLKARQTSWIQVSDGNDRTVFKKLLRAGEQYTVPDGSGYTLITTNAGGLDVVVDGKAAPALGKSGEILRGLSLEPADLSRVKRARSRLNN